jgi:hypothetical protein
MLACLRNEISKKNKKGSVHYWRGVFVNTAVGRAAPHSRVTASRVKPRSRRGVGVLPFVVLLKALLVPSLAFFAGFAYVAFAKPGRHPLLVRQFRFDKARFYSIVRSVPRTTW